MNQQVMNDLRMEDPHIAHSFVRDEYASFFNLFNIKNVYFSGTPDNYVRKVEFNFQNKSFIVDEIYLENSFFLHPLTGLQISAIELFDFFFFEMDSSIQNAYFRQYISITQKGNFFNSYLDSLISSAEVAFFLEVFSDIFSFKDVSQNEEKQFVIKAFKKKSPESPLYQITSDVHYAKTSVIQLDNLKEISFYDAFLSTLVDSNRNIELTFPYPLFQTESELLTKSFLRRLIYDEYLKSDEYRLSQLFGT